MTCKYGPGFKIKKLGCPEMFEIRILINLQVYVLNPKFKTNLFDLQSKLGHGNTIYIFWFQRVGLCINFLFGANPISILLERLIST